MITNKIIHIIIAITGFIVIPVQMITTFVLGILVSLTFGLLFLTITFISIIGIPLAALGDTYVALMPSMGEMDSRFTKLIICQTFPYTWKFLQFQNNKLNIGKNDVLTKILQEVSRAKPLSKYLDGLRADVYSRPDYMNGKYELDW